MVDLTVSMRADGATGLVQWRWTCKGLQNGTAPDHGVGGPLED